MAAPGEAAAAAAAPGGSGGLRRRIAESRAGRWWRGLLQDYAEAAREVARGARRRPGRAAGCLALLAGATACGAAVPGAGSFEAALLEAAGSLLLLSPWIRSGVSEGHVQRLLRLRDRGQLRYRNLVFFALVYEAPFDAEAGLYLAQCRYLQPRWCELPGRILDVGFWGRWWVLHAKMRDCDINEEEFRFLPEHLRAVSFHNLHSEANEKLFEEKYKPVVLTEEQIERAEKEQQQQPPPLPGAVGR
ncbi:mitochondrial import inner membrane translocase subunit Tim29 [Apteryx mantelli]|uniref:Mitochondrial import inner membrane translocase subunit Tim29 n=1 Tax=Apteryx mantelli TaxID=2696672 RepID=A0ABM4G0L4_9AVES